MNEHQNLTMLVSFGRGTFAQPKCSCGWMSRTAYRTDRGASTTRILLSAARRHGEHLAAVQAPEPMLAIVAVDEVLAAVKR